jgi:hypothetical protein
VLEETQAVRTRPPVKRLLVVVTAFTLATSTSTQAELAQEGKLRVSVRGKLEPRLLPRTNEVPVSVRFSGRISSTDGSTPPQLETIAIAINRHGRLSRRGLPVCRPRRINPSTTREALAECRSSLVGEGTFWADVKLPQQSPFPSEGKVIAFNGRFKGHPAILAHIYGPKPVPTSYVMPFTIEHAGKGRFGTVLKAFLPRVTTDWGHVTGLELTLHRRFQDGGQSRSYVAASCPAPKGVQIVGFPLIRTTFAFAGGTALGTVVNRTCRVG